MLKWLKNSKVLIGLVLFFILLVVIINLNSPTLTAISTIKENIVIKNAVIRYRIEKAISKEPNVEYDENGMTLTDERYGNAGMPKSLVLKGVPILCFEWANLGDESKCTPKHLNTINVFFQESKNLDWNKEYFNY